MDHFPYRCMDGVSPPEGSPLNTADALNWAYAEEAKLPWDRVERRFHPSALSGCELALYYDMIGEQPKRVYDPYLHGILEVGTAVHGAIQSHFIKNFPGFESEVVTEIEDLRLYGHCDGVFADEDIILEIKTVGKAGYSKLVRPKQEHILQTHCYMAALDIPRVSLLYVCRDDGARRAFTTTFDRKIWLGILKTMDRTLARVEAKTPPEVSGDFFLCKICRFRHMCPAVAGRGTS